MIKRTISGIILVALIAGSILWSPYSFAVLFALITFLCLWEFYHLFENFLQIKINKIIACFGGVYLFTAGFLYFSKIIPSIEIFLPWMAIFLYLCISDLFKNNLENVHGLAYTFFGQIYIAIPMMLLCRIAFQEIPVEAVNEIARGVMYLPYLLLSFYLLIWISDTMAYCCGILLGKHSLWKRISPKKTWEGLIGGLLFTMIASVIIARFYPILSYGEWIGFGIVVTIFGLFGDLFESLLKRVMHVKDSGNIIPGHGGMLDRFDSDLFAIPAVAIYLFFIL